MRTLALIVYILIYNFSAFAENDLLTLKSGHAKYIPWSSVHWYKVQGGISYNYQQQFISDSKSLFSKKALLSKTKNEIGKLSPSEKLDILLTDYNYSISKNEIYLATKTQANWAGYCDGVVLAQMFYKEPKFKELINSDGIVIPFYSEDQKAILSYLLAYKSESFRRELDAGGVRIKKKTQYFGKRNTGFKYSLNDEDNVLEFHKAVVEKIGIQKKLLFVDVDNDLPVMNQAAFAYDFTINQSFLAGNLDYEITMNLHYADHPIEANIENEGTIKSILTYRYSLSTDEHGNLVGGNWLSTNKPDFFWYPETFEIEEKGVLELFDFKEITH